MNPLKQHGSSLTRACRLKCHVSGTASVAGMYSGYGDQNEDPSVGAKQQRRCTGAVANTILCLEQQAAALASQVKQLELQNQSTRQRHTVLSAICSVTRLGVDVAAGFGSGLAEAAASCSSVLHACSLKAVDMCVGVTLKDHPWAVQAAVAPPPRPLRWPSAADAPLAQQLADGGPLALLQHFLGLLQQHPQQFGWVQRQNPETARDMLHLIQGVIQELLSRTHPSDAPCSTSSNHSSRCSDSRSGEPRRSSATSCSCSGNACSSSSQGIATLPGGHPTGCVEAAAGGGVAAAVAAGGGRALGCTLAFLEVAGVVHDALLEQQQVQQGQAQGQQGGSGTAPGPAGIHGMAGSDQLVHTWAQAILAAAQAGRAVAGSFQGPGQMGPACDAECALLGAVVGFIACLVVLHLSDVEFVMALGHATCSPFPDPLVPYATDATSLSPPQLRDVLWTAAFYADLRRPTWEAQCTLMAQMTALMTATGATAGGGNTTPPASAAPPSRAQPQPPQQQHQQQPQQGPGPQVEEGLGMVSPDRHLLLQETSQRLAVYARVHMWYEALQFSHTWGLLSLRQVAAFLVAVAPVTTSPVCWSMSLLRQLLEGSPWVAAAAELADAKQNSSSSTQAAGRWQQVGGQGQQRAAVPSSEVLSWEPIPPVCVPPHLLGLNSSFPQVQQQQQQQYTAYCRGGDGNWANMSPCPKAMQPQPCQQPVPPPPPPPLQQQQQWVEPSAGAAVPPAMPPPQAPGLQHRGAGLQQQLPPQLQHLSSGDAAAAGYQGAGASLLCGAMVEEVAQERDGLVGAVQGRHQEECTGSQPAQEVCFGAADDDPALLSLRADLALPVNALDMAEALLLSDWAAGCA